MKIRITDLLDNYYDDSVKLSPPEEIFREKEGLTTPVTRPKTSLAQKIMMTAAALILVVTGAFAVVLTLPIQRGASLSKGAPSAPLETFGIEPPESAITSSSTEESMVSAEEAVEPAEIQLEDNAATEIYYMQSNDFLTFNMWFDFPASLLPESADSINNTEILARANTTQGEPLDMVTLDNFVYQDDRCNIYGSAEMGEAQDAPSFCVGLYQGEQGEILPNSGLFSWGASTVPYSADYVYAEGYTNSYLHLLETSAGGAGIKEVAVTKEKEVVLTYEKENTLEATDEELETLGEAIMELSSQEMISIVVRYLGEEMFMVDFSTVPYTLEPGETAGQERLILNLNNYDIDPNQVAGIIFESTAEVETQHQDRIPIDVFGNVLTAAQDLDGDGLLTTEISLPVELDREVGTLVSLSIDLEAGEYIWHKDVPSLELILEGDFSWDYDKALDDIGYNQLETSWTNAFLETWQSKAILVFTDGSGLCLYNGDVIRYEAGDFQDVTQTDFQERIISHLEIDGMHYEFH